MKKHTFIQNINSRSKLIIIAKLFVIVLGKKLFFRILEFIEIRAAFLQGKGFGSLSTEIEHTCVQSLINKISLAIDIGAYKGEYTDKILAKNPMCRVHLFEPSVKNYTYLKKKFYSYNNVYLNNNAVSNKSEEVTLYSDQEGSMLSSLLKRDLSYINKKFEFKEKVKTIKLDDYISNEKLDIIDLIKIDCEGSELNILNSFEKSINKVRCIQFEFGPANIDAKTNFKIFFDFFSNNKFTIYRITAFGPIIIDKYREIEENYTTTNYIALNDNVI